MKKILLVLIGFSLLLTACTADTYIIPGGGSGGAGMQIGGNYNVTIDLPNATANRSIDIINSLNGTASLWVEQTVTAQQFCIGNSCVTSWSSAADGNNYTSNIAFSGTTTKTFTLSRSGMSDLTATFTDNEYNATSLINNVTALSTFAQTKAATGSLSSSTSCLQNITINNNSITGQYTTCGSTSGTNFTLTVNNVDGYLNLTTNGTGINGSVNLTAFDARYLANTVWSLWRDAAYTNITALQTSNTTTNSRIDAIITVDATQNNTITGIYSNVTALQGSNTTIFAQLTAIKNDDSTQNSTISALAQNITGLIASNSTIFNTLTALATNITALQTSNTTIFNQLTAIKSDDNTQNTSISSLQTNVGSLVTNLSTVRDGLYLNVTNLQTSNTSAFNNIASLITNMSSIRDALYTNVTALQSSNTTIFAQLTAIKNDDSTQNTSITNLISANTTLNTRINQVNTTVAGLLTTEATQNSTLAGLYTNTTNLQTSNTSAFSNLASMVTNLSSISSFAQTKAATGYTGYCQYGIAGVTLTNGSAPNITCAAAQGGSPGSGTGNITGNLTQFRIPYAGNSSELGSTNYTYDATNALLNMSNSQGIVLGTSGKLFTGLRSCAAFGNCPYIGASPSFDDRIFIYTPEFVEFQSQGFLLANQINEFRSYFNGSAGVNITNSFGGTATGNLWVQNSVYANETCSIGACVGQLKAISVNATANGTTYVNLNLSLILPNASLMQVDCNLIVNSTAGTNGVQYLQNTTGSPVSVVTTLQAGNRTFSGLSTSSNALSPGDSWGSVYENQRLTSIVRTGTSASNYSIWMRSELAGNLSIMREGSWCQYTRFI